MHQFGAKITHFGTKLAQFGPKSPILAPILTHSGTHGTRAGMPVGVHGGCACLVQCMPVGTPAGMHTPYSVPAGTVAGRYTGQNGPPGYNGELWQMGRIWSNFGKMAHFGQNG